VAGVKRVALFHHDPTRSDDELDALYLDLKKKLQKTASRLLCFRPRRTARSLSNVPFFTGVYP
jgi:hypothetical protein